MEVTEHGTTISINSSLPEEILAFLGRSLRVFVGIFFVIYLLMTQLGGVQGFVISLIILLLGWELMSFFFAITEIFNCIIDKNSQTVTVTKRNPATFWKASMVSYKLQDLKLISFGKNDDSENKLSLKFKTTGWETFAGLASTKIAETLSTSLQVPLQIEFGDERITHVPWMSNLNPDLVSTPCLSCGAPLPPIALNSSHIKCSHCGMNMVIQWGDGKFSYRKQAE